MHLDPNGPVEAEVRVLGPPLVDGPGRPDPEQIEFLTEIVVFLALHRDGAYPVTLAGFLGMQELTGPGSAADSAAGPGADAGGAGAAGAASGPAPAVARIERALVAAQDWLGVDAEGRPRLGPTPDGRWQLSPDVRCDWELFVAYVHRSGMPGADRESDLRAALQLVNGPLWTDLPPGRYRWVTSGPIERTMRTLVVDTAHQLAMLTLEHGDTVTAMAACRTGLRAAPTSELLWRDLLRTVAARGDRRTLEAVATELYRSVGGKSTRRGSGVEPETDALVQSLLPGFRRRRH